MFPGETKSQAQVSRAHGPRGKMYNVICEDSDADLEV